MQELGLAANVFAAVATRGMQKEGATSAPAKPFDTSPSGQKRLGTGIFLDGRLSMSTSGVQSADANMLTMGTTL